MKKLPKPEIEESVFKFNDQLLCVITPRHTYSLARTSKKGGCARKWCGLPPALPKEYLVALRKIHGFTQYVLVGGYKFT